MEIPGDPMVKPPGLRDWGGGKDGTPRCCTGQTLRAFYSRQNISSYAFFKGQVRKPPSRLSSDQNLSFSELCHTAALLHLAFSSLCAQWCSEFGCQVTFILHECVGVGIRVHMWRLEDNLRDHSSGVFQLFFF